MTKDWDVVQAEIKDLSFVQKKKLDQVKRIMEEKHGFKASYALHSTMVPDCCVPKRILTLL